jgi:3-oxoacyl-[acyl-carrier protein] reductase
VATPHDEACREARIALHNHGWWLDLRWVFPPARNGLDHRSMTTTTLTEDLLAPAARRLDGKVALVTGANGAAAGPVARALAAGGADVLLVHRGHDVPVVRALAAEIAQEGHAAADVVADTSRPDGVAAAFDAALDRFGRLDVVVHLPGRAVRGPLAELTDEDWHSGTATNLDSAFYVLREAARRLDDGGRVILLSTSLTGVTAPGYGSYAPAKAAVEHLVRAGAKELGARGITVNAVAPGPIDSPFVRDAEEPEGIARLEQFSPMGRLGTWEDVAPLIAFLATEQARWITAQTIRVNGGMTA